MRSLEYPVVVATICVRNLFGLDWIACVFVSSYLTHLYPHVLPLYSIFRDTMAPSLRNGNNWINLALMS